MNSPTDSQINYNPWNLKELEYNGRLYHYTGVKACKGIFGRVDCSDYPEDCISLRFTRIDCMTKNDPSERKHIDTAVKKIAKKLSKFERISDDFSRIICNFTPTNKGFYRLALDKMDHQFHKPQHQLSCCFGPVDYFVACFSINPHNECIMEEHKTSVCITFNEDFTRMYDNDFRIHRYRPEIKHNNFLYVYPSKIIHNCFLDTYLRRVEYVDTFVDIDKIESDLIEKKILDIFEYYQEKKQAEDIEQDIMRSIEDMYSMCDAFVKDTKHKYEEEVRFVIRLPQKEHFQKEHGFYPKWLSDNHFVHDTDWTYIQIPISDKFVTL